MCFPPPPPPHRFHCVQHVAIGTVIAFRLSTQTRANPLGLNLLHGRERLNNGWIFLWVFRWESPVPDPTTRKEAWTPTGGVCRFSVLVVVSSRLSQFVPWSEKAGVLNELRKANLHGCVTDSCGPNSYSRSCQEAALVLRKFVSS